VALAALSQFGSATFEAKTCDCSVKELIGTLRHDIDVECSTETIESEIDVAYTVRRRKKPAKMFKAYMCSRWLVAKTVTTFLLGGRDTVPLKPRPVPVSRNECYLMAAYKDCKGEKMIKDGNVYSYKADPVGEGSWWTTVTYETMNCVLEETTVEKECNDCHTTTVWGTLAVDPDREFAEHNHIMYIWNNTEHIGDKKCEMEVLHSGRGRIPFPSGKTKGPRRLRDRKQQLDFIIAAEGTTDCDGRGSHQILNAPDMTVEITQDPLQRKIEVRTSASMGEHLQYIRDSLLEIVNNVTRETRLLECAIRTLRRNQVVNAAHSDGILAAEQMGLPPCHLVEGYGDMATVWWCQTISTLFSPRNTSCGVEPAAGRLTIAKNGWTLIPHQECEWKHNLANFNGALYLWNTTAGNWTRIEPNLDVSHGPMMRKFELDIENWDQWAEVPHPGMSESNRQQLEQLLDMIAENNPDMANPEEPSLFIPWITPSTPAWKKAGYSIAAILTVLIPIGCVWFCCGREAVMPCICGCLGFTISCLRCCKRSKKGVDNQEIRSRMFPEGIV